MRILALDIETAPALVYTFSLFKPVIGHTQIKDSSRIICFSAQWVGDRKVQFYSEFHNEPAEMRQALWDLMDEADAIITYNGSKFDLPWIRGELNVHGYPPPSPSASIDLYQVIRSNARFLSNKLDYVAQRFLDEAKVTHTGFQLWLDCMAGDEKAWRLMKKYAIQDTKLLIPLYERLRPWIKSHPNLSIGMQHVACPRCQSTNFERRGYLAKTSGKYQRYRCNSCSGWFSDTRRSQTTTVTAA